MDSFNKIEKLSIKHWSEEDQPREKLMAKGRQVLSDAELLAILIGSGNRSESAIELCKRILNDSQNNINQLAKLSVNDLMKYRGIGEAKAISIVAALELGRRRKSEAVLDKVQVTSSQHLYEYIKPVLEDLPHEEFWIVLLSRANKIIGKQLIGRGGISETTADIKLIFKKSIESLASAIILAHNHPSGNLKPSQSDLNLTKKIKDAAKLFDISILDHLIIGDGNYYSFNDEGVL
ncbi:DNA repair protein RadC [Flavobacteriales bacterium]|nr:DNA repair protein RadC [Flavobacteriales bacterium]MDC0015398.1 DNA repair protein RadC [Flavobacteriales bacterium]MDC1371063.1 DNA repair protein RadC [Flavobacteriales bacterium]